MITPSILQLPSIIFFSCQTILHVKLVNLMIAGQNVVNKALDKVPIALREMLEMPHMSLVFT